MSEEDLAGFVRERLDSIGYVRRDGPPRSLAEPPAEDEADGEEPEDDGEPEEQPVEPSPSEMAAAEIGLEAAATWSAALTDAERAAFVADPELGSEQFLMWLRSQTDNVTARQLHEGWLASGSSEPEEPADAIQEASLAPIGQQVVEAAFESPELLPDGMSPEAWLLWAVEAPRAEWEAACEESGWDPKARPSSWDLLELAPGVAAERTRRSFAARVARARETGKYVE